MKKVKFIEWEEEFIKDGKTEKQKSDTIMLLDFLLNHQDPRKTILKGMDNFRTRGRIRKVLNNYDKSGLSKFLEFLDPDYLFLKKLVEEDIPAHFADNPGIIEAVENFLSPLE
jgi:hypothetical protein